MLRIISVARITGQTGELILAGNRCYHHCSSRWRSAKPLASPIDNMKVGELLPMDCLPFLPPTIQTVLRRYTAISASICAVNNTTAEALELQQTFAAVAIAATNAKKCRASIFMCNSRRTFF